MARIGNSGIVINCNPIFESPQSLRKKPQRDAVKRVKEGLVSNA